MFRRIICVLESCKVMHPKIVYIKPSFRWLRLCGIRFDETKESAMGFLKENLFNTVWNNLAEKVGASNM